MLIAASRLYRFADQLLAEDNETVKKKFEASFFSRRVLRLRPPNGAGWPTCAAPASRGTKTGIKT